MSDRPQIYEAMVRVMQDIGYIGKDQTNAYDKYKFRGIDDVYNALQPALVKNGIFCVPQLLELTQTDRESRKGDQMVHTVVKVRLTLYAADGSSVECIMPGESMDRSDKSVNKAMTAAFKYAMFEIFCIPVKDLEDADKESPEAGTKVDKKISPMMASAMRTALAEMGVSEDGACKYVGAEKLEDLTDSQYSQLNQMLNDEKNRRRAKKQ